MGIYIMGAFITMIFMVFKILGNWDEYEYDLGIVGVYGLTVLAFTIGLILWPLTLAITAIMFVISVRKKRQWRANS